MKHRSGTAGYMAPELKGSQIKITPAIDMWAFGIILYELAVAYKPTQIKQYKYTSGQPIPFFERDWKLHGAKIKELI
jgi:serine/threonine protein kinase